MKGWNKITLRYFRFEKREKIVKNLLVVYDWQSSTNERLSLKMYIKYIDYVFLLKILQRLIHEIYVTQSLASGTTISVTKHGLHAKALKICFFLNVNILSFWNFFLYNKVWVYENAKSWGKSLFNFRERTAVNETRVRSGLFYASQARALAQTLLATTIADAATENF